MSAPSREAELDAEETEGMAAAYRRIFHLEYRLRERDDQILRLKDKLDVVVKR